MSERGRRRRWRVDRAARRRPALLPAGRRNQRGLSASSASGGGRDGAPGARSAPQPTQHERRQEQAPRTRGVGGPTDGAGGSVVVRAGWQRGRQWLSAARPSERLNWSFAMLAIFSARSSWLPGGGPTLAPSERGTRRRHGHDARGGLWRRLSASRGGWRRYRRAAACRGGRQGWRAGRGVGRRAGAAGGASHNTPNGFIHAGGLRWRSLRWLGSDVAISCGADGGVGVGRGGGAGATAQSRRSRAAAACPAWASADLDAADGRRGRRPHGASRKGGAHQQEDRRRRDAGRPQPRAVHKPLQRSCPARASPCVRRSRRRPASRAPPNRPRTRARGRTHRRP